MKNKLAYIAIIIAISLVLLCAAYIILHMTCGTAHLAKHIHLDMTRDEVERLLGEPYGQTNGSVDWVYHLDDGSELWIHFSPEDPDIMYSEYTVHGYSYYEKGSGDVWFNICATLLVCAVCFGAAFLIRRILNRPKITLKGVRQWFISRKSTLAYIAIVISISLMLLIVASVIFHTNCGTAHLARHVRLGMSYHELVKLLGEPISINNAMNTATYKLQDGNFFRVYLWADMKIPDAQWEDQVIVHGYSYDKALPMVEIGLIVGAALLVCAIGGTAAILISRKLKQPTA